MIVDLFAGGGGATTGIEAALGRTVDVAVNHSQAAISMHLVNHPGARHFCEDVFDVSPKVATKGRQVDLLWLSPDCTHFSRAKGGKPRSKKTRALAWIAVRWAAEVKPNVIMLENVPEFLTWGPVDSEGQPIASRAGETFQEWLWALKGLGYEVEHRVLSAADYGAPTSRKRLFLVARRDGLPIAWPEPTHGPGRGKPWRTAAEIIDWSLPCPSIFERKRPLAEPTMLRIATGIRRYVLGAARPFIVPVTHPRDARVHSIDEPLRTVTAANRGELALIAPTLIQTSYGERPGQAPRVLDLHKPLGTVVAGGSKHALVAAFLVKHYGGVVGHGLRQPIGTVTATDHHSLVEARLEAVAGRHSAEVRALLDRLAPAAGDSVEPIVDVDGEPYLIADIGMRMLSPRELFRAQGFGEDYTIELERRDGKPLTKTEQITLAGNSVCPPLAEALVRANVGRSGGFRAAA